MVTITGVTAFAAADSTDDKANSQRFAELTDEEKAEITVKIKERLDQRLADGKITQEQYDQAITSLENGDLKRLGRGMGGSGRPELTDEQKAEMIIKAKERLAQQLADEKITQEQYDQAITNLENGDYKVLRKTIGFREEYK